MFEVIENIPLAPYTTFDIGGAARYFVDVKSDDDLNEALTWAKENNKDYFILAGGSNVLAADGGFAGLVIHIASDGCSFAGRELAADAGCTLLDLIKIASEHGLGGWESMAGIPGTIGGAARGNAGAFGSEIKDFAVKVLATNAETGEVRAFTNAECAFSYRHSFFKTHPEWIITRVYIDLHRADKLESAQKIRDTVAEREKRHLQNVKAAGSFFMNPVAPHEIVVKFEQEKRAESRGNRVPAGWLIEQSGMKGVSVGGAVASLQHPNYIVNVGNATASDVRELATQIKIAVHEKFGITLHEEAAMLS